MVHIALWLRSANICWRATMRHMQLIINSRSFEFKLGRLSMAEICHNILDDSQRFLLSHTKYLSLMN
jgi:hypothetical protein